MASIVYAVGLKPTYLQELRPATKDGAIVPNRYRAIVTHNLQNAMCVPTAKLTGALQAMEDKFNPDPDAPRTGIVSEDIDEYLEALENEMKAQAREGRKRAKNA